MGYASSGNPPLKKCLTKIIKFVIIIIGIKKGGKYYGYERSISIKNRK